MTRQEKWVVLGLLLALLLGVAVRTYRRGHPFAGESDSFPQSASPFRAEAQI